MAKKSHSAAVGLGLDQSHASKHSSHNLHILLFQSQIYYIPFALEREWVENTVPGLSYEWQSFNSV